MDTRNKTLLILPAVITLLALTGCAEAPVAQVQAGRQALDKAIQAQAEEYASTELRSAQEAMRQLDAELKAQEEKFALFRSYETTQRLITQVSEAASRAEEAARAGKEAARNQAAEAISSFKTTLDSLRESVAQAPAGKGTQFDLVAMRSDLAGIEASIPEIDDAYSAGRYGEATAKANAARESAMSIGAEITTAIQARDAAKSAARGKRTSKQS